MGKRTYESVAAIAAALPESGREEFAALLDDIERNAINAGSIRGTAIKRWLRDAGWRQG